VARVTRAHHVLCVEHLLGQFGYSERTILLAASGGEGSKSNHEEMQTGEGN
jgi:hypothetical protein